MECMQLTEDLILSLELLLRLKNILFINSAKQGLFSLLIINEKNILTKRILIH